MPIDDGRYLLDQWVGRIFEMALAVKRGLLRIDYLHRFASPSMAAQLVKMVDDTPLTIKVKPQWCKATFIALSPHDPPAVMGAVVQRSGGLWLAGLMPLPDRRYR